MQHLNNFCKMRHHLRARYRVLTSNLAWTYGQTRSNSNGTAEHRRPLVTLDPEKIKMPTSRQHPRELSGTLDISLTVQTRSAFIGGVAIRYCTERRRYMPFPDKTRGFLYYNGPKPGYPDFSGSFRFRVIPESGSNESFEKGIDLRLPSGVMWEIHLYTALRTTRHAGLILKLVEEGLITSSTIEKLREMPLVLFRGTSQILYHLEDPFVARFHTVESLIFMSQDDVESGQIMPMFKDPRKHIDRHPYEGTALVRFERSTLPEHANSRTIVLRILRELSPIRCVLEDYDSYIAMPTPGELLYGTYERKGGSYRPWSANLDIARGKAGSGKAVRMISMLWPPAPSAKNATT